MPSEPDNTKMEELLKAYARKRRDAAGTPLNVHPATRRMLQEEVARAYPKSDPSEGFTWQRLLFQFWPRVAFAMGVAVLLGGTLWLLNRPPREPQVVSFAKNDTADPRSSSRSDLGFKDFDEPADVAKSMSARRGLKVTEKEALPPQKPSQPAPVAVLTAPAPAPTEKLNEEIRLTLEDQLARKTIAEKQKIDDLATVQNRARSYAANPAPAALPALAAPAPEAAEQKMAKAQSKQSDDRPALRGELAANNLKAGKDVSQDLDSLAVAEQNRKPSILAQSLDAKEAPAKKAPSSSLASSASGSAVKTENQSSLGVAVREAMTPQSLSLTDGAVTSWTNTATAQSWSFQRSESELGRGTQFGEGLASNSPRPTGATPAADRDGDLVGNFGNVAGDGRYGRFKTQQDFNLAVPGSVVNGPVVASGVQPPESYGLSNGRGFATNRPDTSGVQQYRQMAEFGSKTNSATVFYSQAGLGGGRIGNSTSKAAEGSQVLEHFQLVQNGETLRIVDSDGSVYEGKMLPSDQMQGQLRLLERTGLERDTVKAAAIETEERLKRRSTAAPGLQPAQFKLSGVNRTLGQLVVVTGRLERQPLTVFYDSESLSDKAQSGASRQKPAPNGIITPPSAAKANSTVTTTNTAVRMSGVATIGGTNQIRLEAIPANR